MSQRQRLSAKFTHQVIDHCLALEATGQAEKAIVCYLRALEADDRAGAIHQALIRCYRNLGREAEAQAAGERYATIKIM